MSGVGRSWRTRKHWAALFACGPIALAGCGGSEDPAEATTATAPAAPAGPGAAAPGGSHGTPVVAGDMHGGDGSGAMADMHGSSAGQGAPQVHDAPLGTSSAGAVASSAGMHGGPSGSHDIPSGSSAGAGGSHSAPLGSSAGAGGSHGAPLRSSAGAGGSHAAPLGSSAGAPVTSAGAPLGTSSAGGPVSHDSSAGVAAAAQGVPVNSGGSSAGAAGGHDAPIASTPVGGHGQADSGGATPVGGHGQMTPGATATGSPEFPGQAPGSVPGGYAGADIPGANAGPAQTFEEGTAEYAVQQLVLKMQSGETEGIDKLISEKTKDPALAPLLEESVDADRIKKNQELVAGANLTSRRESGGSKLFVVNNAGGQVLTFSARRDGDDYKVFSIRVETPRGVKPRQ